MAWHQLAIDKPHLVYIILGGFTSIFMLCSLFIKEKLYIGEATVATICGVIFGPHAANLINPLTWGNTDQITLEFSRIVLVVQCFAVGVELPKAYMERHWKSVVFLLVPVMTFGWLITSLFIWWMIVPLSWLESLVVAACVTATDPVLASSVVGKGKFAKRVPKHLRDVLSAESGCNDGMAFPFIYLSLYLVRYHLRAREVIFHWTCFTILYECIFGAFYGVMVGYIGRHAIKFAERKGLIDRESFLVFYFVLALFCAGSGSLLGMDDLLIGFAAGVGFSNDGWFTEKTEESHVSNVIDLLLNLAYFVYFGTIIPWDQYNAHAHGLVPWRLVVISIMVIFFRRIPAMLALKPLIPDVKTWREALFAGHFGPIGVGAIFAAILARAELETDGTTPLAKLPEGSEEFELIYLLWPLVTFLVISSILVHGSSIAVFTLGKRINTLTITLSYTQDNEKGPAWMQRLPRITSQSRSMSRRESSELDVDEKLEIPPGELPPIGIPKLHLRRQREDEYEKRPASRSSSHGRARRRRKRDRALEERLGGPVSQSAIAPSRLSEPILVQQESGSDTLFDKSGEPSPQSRPERVEVGSATPSPERHEQEAEPERARARRTRSPPPPDTPADVEAYEEGDDIVVEDEEGNVIDTIDASHMSPDEKADAIEKARNRLAKDVSGKFAKHKHEPHPRNEGEEMEEEMEQAVMPKSMRQRFDQWKGFGRRKDGEAEPSSSKQGERKRGPAHAYQFGNTVIVEDEDGEVIKTYNIPSESSGPGGDKSREQQVRDGLRRMSTWVGLGRQTGPAAGPVDPAGPSVDAPAPSETLDQPKEEVVKKRDFRRRISDASSDDDGLRMTISKADQYGLTGLQKKARDAPGTIALGSGRRLSTRDFIKQMQQLDPKSKIREVERSDATEDIKREVRRAAKMERGGLGKLTASEESPTRGRTEPNLGGTSTVRRPDAGRRTASEQEADDYFSPQRRPRPDRLATRERNPTLSEESEEDEEDEEEDEGEIPTHNVRSSLAKHGKGQTAADLRRRHLARIRSEEEEENDEEGETAAEKRRRMAALGLGDGDEDSSSEGDEDEPRRTEAAVPEPTQEASSSSTQPKARIQWGGESGREKKDPYDIYAGDPIVGAARKIRGMMKKRG
ncbi:sodium/hydrogen antiporter [Fonsecaea monophora]|uniref:Sodium/hydrogen antiporter n=1 Tax=Fonsecaea monophora TaxID=254056 RepID=A0A177FNJ8_9EURO|nr:sodium/hydrogen antiporter [Fonsecaea monophora]KAH0844395.1 Na(+)/H(+) antiporter 2 [Fonsecaea pedrosoi]OAG44902.1 sodium/hydrogen antiporter [Fonsecaea monophora]